MIFQRAIIRDLKAFPGKTSAIVHTIGCNLNCYGCFNYEALISNPQNTCGKEEILDLLEKTKGLYDIVIISGGDPLIYPIEELVSFVKAIEKLEKVSILYSNGTFPDKIEHLFEEGLRGVHLDIKVLDREKENEILGVEKSHIEEIKKSIKIVSKNNSPFSEFRTVYYPQYKDEDLDFIGDFIFKIQKENNSNIPWYINEYKEDL